MKILHLSTFDNAGGAAKAAYRLHIGLIKNSCESTMMVMFRDCDRDDVIGPSKGSFEFEINRARRFIEDKIVQVLAKPNAMFYAELLPNRISRFVNSSDYDIVHLHWVTGGFLDIKTIGQICKPIVWTLHDSWAFTGGCHIPGGCKAYVTGCGRCPLFKNNSKNDLSSFVIKRKLKYWQKNNITIVSPSNWLAGCAGSSLLFKTNRVEVIPNGIDSELFKPVDKLVAKKLFNIPLNKCAVLFGAINYWKDRNKGLDFLIEAINQLPAGFKQKITLIIVGKENLPPKLSAINVSMVSVGNLHDQISMAALYSASDVTVVPSISENFSNMVVESLLCGTPIAAFAIGGMPDLINHKINGYLAEPYKTDELSKGILWILEDTVRYIALSNNCRAISIENLTVDRQVERYCRLYGELKS